ncbi:MAG: biosynthetic-type acetolactate synthase large subunit [Candidatus Ancillula sp.]|jgi:acetolactate synthase-1/2/3 large subunit|nr:biosynthetic-type acetolactate synthase large subunit [Candidatus Ancillula sp.]
MDGSHAIVRTLEDLGVDVVFGLPGGAILTAYNAINNDTKFRHILVRHEQGAGHAASGYAQVTGKVGVAMVTSGPAATNIVTAIADANMDSVPMVVITGQVATPLIGSDAFQEADIVGITLPITKHSYLVTNASDIPRVLAEAFHIAHTGRPGVVLVDVTKSAMTGHLEYEFPTHLEIEGYKPKDRPDHQCLEKALGLIRAAKRPAIYAGGGLMRADAGDELLRFATCLNAPIATTLQARGIAPDSHHLSLGMVGMHGTIASAAALQECDLLLVLGARFSDRVTGKLANFATSAKVVQIDIDPAEIGKNRHVDAPLYGDVKETLTELLSVLESEIDQNQQRDETRDKTRDKTSAWWERINQLRYQYPLYLDEDLARESGCVGKGAISPQYVIQKVGEIAKKYDPDAIFAAGVGQHQMWASQFLGFEKPHTWVQSAGLGTMGYAIPAAMGAKAGKLGNDVWVIDGDGSFQMTNQELATCRLNGFPIKVMLINNGTLGMPRQWQTLLFDKHYSQTDLHDGADGWDGEILHGDGEELIGGGNGVPDYIKLAEAYDCLAIRVTTPEDVIPALEAAAKEKERPVLVEFQVAKDAMVFPMVPAGSSNNDIIYRPGVQPLKQDSQIPPQELTQASAPRPGGAI